jgi:hypothetical protein
MGFNPRSVSIVTMPVTLAYLPNSHPVVSLILLLTRTRQANTLADGVKCYTGSSAAFTPILHSGSVTQTCSWAGDVQSLYCKGFKNNKIPTGTHTLTYSAADGFTPFPVTNFVVAQTQATTTVTFTRQATQTSASGTASATTTVTITPISLRKRAHC